jgi:hypothetical protein
MLIDEKEFFREATLRICGSLEIEKALQSCLLYIRSYLPAGQMSFHRYHRDLGIVETLAHATPETSKILSIKTPLPARATSSVLCGCGSSIAWETTG